MEITPCDNFDRYNAKFNRQLRNALIIAFGIAVVAGISIWIIEASNKMKKNKSGENQKNGSNEQ